MAVEESDAGKVEQSWFINEEDRLFKGIDYTTKEEDTHKLLKFLQKNLSK